LDFFGIGSGELILVMVIALIVFGPGKLVQISQQLGKMVREFRKVAFEVTTQVTKELESEEQKYLPQSQGEKSLSKSNKP
jgi:Tat protein translocase TatB subunit